MPNIHCRYRAYVALVYYALHSFALLWKFLRDSIMQCGVRPDLLLFWRNQGKAGKTGHHRNDLACGECAYGHGLMAGRPRHQLQRKRWHCIPTTLISPGQRKSTTIPLPHWQTKPSVKVCRKATISSSSWGDSPRSPISVAFIFSATSAGGHIPGMSRVLLKRTISLRVLK